MKQTMCKLVFVIIAMLFVHNSCTSGSADVNPNTWATISFEEKGGGGLPRGWKVVPAYEGRGDASLDDKNAHTGTYSLHLKPNHKNSSAGAYGVVMMLNPADIKGKEITITGFAKVSNIGDNNAAILLKTDTENWIVLPKDTNDQFVPFSKTFSISDKIPAPGLLLLISGTKGDVWFDDITISQTRGSAESPQKPSVTDHPETDKENLIKNGGFEEKGEVGLPKGWKVAPANEGRGDASLDSKNAHAGTYSLRISPNKRNTSGGFGVFTELDPDKVRGKEITISGFAKLQGMGDTPAGILFKTDTENWLILPQAVQGEFFSFSKTFPVADSIPHAFLFFIAGGNKGSAWLDDLSLTVEAAPAPKNLRTTQPTSSVSDPFVDKINTPGWQDSAFITPDGKELYFAYTPYAQNDFMNIYAGKISEQDVKIRGPIREGSKGTLIFETYKSVRREDGTWGRPQRLDINSTYSLYSAKLSHDGKELYYAIRGYNKNYGEDDIYVSKRLPDGRWGPPENLGPDINTIYREDTPCLTADGNTLYFARNKKEIFGWEIMVSRRVNGKWSKPQKLGQPINEPHPERTANYQPFITADGKEFYFTRGQQLFKSNLQPDGKWGKPIQVFPQLPVSGHASVTDDGRYLYFLTAKDHESLRRQSYTIWYSERQKDGNWGPPKPVD